MFAAFAIAFALGQPSAAASAGEEVVVCSRTMRFEDQYCAARMSGRRWGHREAAEAHELAARYALPHRAAESWLFAANNWVGAAEPAKAAVAFDRALAAGLAPEVAAAVGAARLCLRVSSGDGSSIAQKADERPGFGCNY